MDNLKVTLIVPVYNQEKYIEKCIMSIENQTYKDIELIIVDDGSEDNTNIICKKLAKKYNNIKLYTKKNGGVSSARNFGLEKASGDIIGFVDGDDYLDINFVQDHITNMTTTNSCVSIISLDKMNNGIEKTVYKDNKKEILKDEDALSAIIIKNSISSGCLNKMYKADVIGKIRFKDYAVAEDLYFNYEVLKQDNIRIVFQDKELYKYRINSEGSIMHTDFKKKNLDILKVYDRLIIETENSNIKFNKYIKNSYVFINMKLIMKMVSSRYYNKDIYDKCINNINKYKNGILNTKYISISKKIFFIFFIIFKKQITKSYNKQNIFYKICTIMNKKVG